MKRDLGLLAAREHDLLIVGGGIYGVTAAWDAAQRGLHVALIEAEDFGAGVSWNSLKTIHGGLRHLQKADIGQMRESLRERRALLRIAPVLVKPLNFLVPTYGHGAKGREALAAGLWLFDLLGRDRNHGLAPEQRIPPARSLSRRDVLDLIPGLPEGGLTGGALWTDAQVSSSERLSLGFVHAAVEAGAIVANHAAATGFLRAGARVSGVLAKDTLTGGSLEVRARLVLNAAGPGVDDLLGGAGIKRPKAPLLRAMNLVLGRPAAAGGRALGANSGGRFLFLVPWRDRSLIGTAYEPAETDGAGAVEAFVAEAASAFPWVGLTPDDVVLVHRGLVPGRNGAGGLVTRPRLLDHETTDGVPGLVSVQGVKYTTARGVAEKVVDLIFRRLGRPSPKCRTAITPLARARPLEGPLAERVGEAVRDEMAVTLEDAVLRRLDLGTVGPPSAVDLETVVGAMAAALGWDRVRVGLERAALAKTYRHA
ncbi:MAG TPA: FAD-dependent oxidoreductase [Vicinamibacteria bacterium]|nr:FAD-dependent oxidoreductase [Vicinamibacteria bacterium]